MRDDSDTWCVLPFCPCVLGRPKASGLRSPAKGLLFAVGSEEFQRAAIARRNENLWGTANPSGREAKQKTRSAPGRGIEPRSRAQHRVRKVSPQERAFSLSVLKGGNVRCAGIPERRVPPRRDCKAPQWSKRNYSRHHTKFCGTGYVAVWPRFERCGRSVEFLKTRACSVLTRLITVVRI